MVPLVFEILLRFESRADCFYECKLIIKQLQSTAPDYKGINLRIKLLEILQQSKSGVNVFLELL